MKKTHALALSFILLFTVGSCAVLKQIVQMPKVKFVNLDYTNPTLDSITLLFNLDVNNPNPIGAPINGIDYQIFLENKSFLQGRHNKSMHIPAMASNTVGIPVKVHFKDIIQATRNLKGRELINYSLKSNVGIGPFKIPVIHTGKIKIPKLPKIKVHSLNVGRMGLTQSSLVLNMDIQNDNSFPIPLNGLNYQFSIGGQQLASASKVQQKSIGSGSRTRLQIPIAFNPLKLGTTGLKLLKKGSKLNYELKGSFWNNDPKTGKKSLSPFNIKDLVKIL